MKTQENELRNVTPDKKMELTLQFMRAKWSFLNKQHGDVFFSQKKMIEELAKISHMIKPADLEIIGATEISIQKYSAACFFAGLLDFKTGAIQKNVVDLDYRITIESGSRIECGRRFGHLFGFEPRVSQLQHGPDVTGFVMMNIRGLK